MDEIDGVDYWRPGQAPTVAGAFIDAFSTACRDLWNDWDGTGAHKVPDWVCIPEDIMPEVEGLYHPMINVAIPVRRVPIIGFNEA